MIEKRSKSLLNDKKNDQKPLLNSFEWPIDHLIPFRFFTSQNPPKHVIFVPLWCCPIHFCIILTKKFPKNSINEDVRGTKNINKEITQKKEYLGPGSLSHIVSCSLSQLKSYDLQPVNLLPKHKNIFIVCLSTVRLPFVLTFENGSHETHSSHKNATVFDDITTKSEKRVGKTGKTKNGVRKRNEFKKTNNNLGEKSLVTT